MKVCITRSRKSGYTETFIRNQVIGLAKKTEVVTLHSGRLPQRTEDGKLVGPWIFWILNQTIKGLTGNRNNYFGQYGLRKFLRKEKVDVVVSNYGLSGAHFVPICKDMNIPLIVIFHGYDATLKKIVNRYLKSYRKLFDYASAVIAVSTEMKGKLVALGCPAEKINVIPMGIDPQKFSPPTERKNESLIIGVGRLTPKKAPHITIQAFHKVWLKHPEAKLVLIGDKSGLYNECVQLIKKLKLNGAVEFTGQLPPDQVSGWMRRANIFVQHSVTAPNGDMEGTPNSILEAAASELPIVSTQHGGIKEAVKEGVTGYLVPEHDDAGMSDRIIKLIENPILAAKMGAEGRQHILDNYTLSDQIDKIYGLIKLADSAKTKTSLIISVYKNVTDLYAVLEALKFQTYTDFEIIVSEDGQSDEMREFLENYNHPNKIIHTVQPDIGWRKNMALNNAVRHANGEYLIFIDGDCVPHHKFIENHIRYAAPGRIVAGKRIKLGEKYSDLFRTSIANLFSLETRVKMKPWEVISDGAMFYEDGFYIDPDGLLGFIPRLRKMHQLKGCNMSFYRGALEKINGFDEDYVRPAIGEDIDLTWRFEGVGYELFSVRNLAVQYHLHHKENWTNQDENERLMLAKIKDKKYVCENGLQKLR